jgi:dethiobiotin synthetase
MKKNVINIINGVNTNAGKTYATIKSITQFNLNINEICILKPIISGFLDEDNDVALYLKFLDLPATASNIDKISCYYFKEPVSPNIAAALEGIGVDYEKLLEFCIIKIKNALGKNQSIFVEMAGGICSPISKNKTMLDLTKDITNFFKKTEVNNVLITSNYLGSISHTISACALFDFDEIIFNPITQSSHDKEIKNTMESFIKKPIHYL